MSRLARAAIPPIRSTPKTAGKSKRHAVVSVPNASWSARTDYPGYVFRVTFSRVHDRRFRFRATDKRPARIKRSVGEAADSTEVRSTFRQSRESTRAMALQGRRGAPPQGDGLAAPSYAKRPKCYRKKWDEHVAGSIFSSVRPVFWLGVSPPLPTDFRSAQSVPSKMKNLPPRTFWGMVQRWVTVRPVACDRKTGRFRCLSRRRQRG